MGENTSRLSVFFFGVSKLRISKRDYRHQHSFCQFHSRSQSVYHSVSLMTAILISSLLIQLFSIISNNVELFYFFSPVKLLPIHHLYYGKDSSQFITANCLAWGLLSLPLSPSLSPYMVTFKTQHDPNDNHVELKAESRCENYTELDQIVLLFRYYAQIRL